MRSCIPTRTSMPPRRDYLAEAARANEEFARAKRERDQAIRRAVKAGFSYREVGDAVGMSHEGVRLLLDPTKRRSASA